MNGGVASESFDALAVERYRGLTDKVRRGPVHEGTGATAFTASEVRFRDGILKWTENESIDWDDRTLAFDQLNGDFDNFSAAWEHLNTLGENVSERARSRRATGRDDDSRRRVTVHGESRPSAVSSLPGPAPYASADAAPGPLPSTACARLTAPSCPLAWRSVARRIPRAL